MGAIFVKIGSVLMKVIAPFLPYLFDWIGKQISTWWENRQKKKADDKRADDSAGKIVNGDLKEGLEGTDELEDEFNRHT